MLFSEPVVTNKLIYTQINRIKHIHTFIDIHITTYTYIDMYIRS